jgi:hypothetical protein
MIHQAMYFLPLSYYHVCIGKILPTFYGGHGNLSKVINPHSKFCVLHASVFSMNFLCSLNAHHPWEDAEKVAILPKKILANLSINQIRSSNFKSSCLYFWLLTESKYKLSGDYITSVD